MKQNRSRLIALLLAMCLLVGALPTLALADDAILTMDDYQNARNRVEEALAAVSGPRVVAGSLYLVGAARALLKGESVWNFTTSRCS